MHRQTMSWVSMVILNPVNLTLIASKCHTWVIWRSKHLFGMSHFWLWLSLRPRFKSRSNSYRVGLVISPCLSFSFLPPATGNGLPSLQAGHNEAFVIIKWNNSSHVMWTVESIAQENRSFYFFSVTFRPWYLWRVLCMSPPSLGSKIHDNKEWSFPQAFHQEAHLAIHGHRTGLGRWLTSLLPRCSSEGGLCL